MYTEYRRTNDATVIVKCQACKHLHEVVFSTMQEQHWKDGEYIQRVAPRLTAGERELLISGYCDDCFESMFAHDEED